MTSNGSLVPVSPNTAKALPAALDQYDPSQVPGIFRMEGFGHLCYMNALLQSFLSLSSANREILRINASTKRTPLTEALQRLIKTEITVTEQIPSSDAVKVWHAMRQCQTDRHEFVFGRQQDVHEGLTFLIDALGKDVQSHFEIRYACEIICNKCGARRPAGPTKDWVAPPEILTDLTEVEMPVSNQQQVQAYLLGHHQYPRDYACETCGAKNIATLGPKKEVISVEKNVKQQYSLRRVNEVIVLYFKKYERKTRQYFPPALDFDATQGILHYEAVAQIDHYGGLNGGHYVARIIRPKPKGFQIQRESDLQAELERERDPVRRLALQTKIASWQRHSRFPNAVFLLNDTEVKYAGNVEPTENTYMVFYHLQRIEPKETKK